MYIKVFFILIITVYKYDFLCLNSDHKCGPNDINECISKSWVCDYNVDCEDGSDELKCPEFRCDKDQFKCLGVNKCISKDLICNGNIDCPNNSDELNCASTKKSCNEITEYDCKNVKSLECIPLEGVCNKKFNCSTNRNAKEDCNVNMCEKNSCTHMCINKYSSFVCNCPQNMVLDKDNITCKHLNKCLESPQICSQGCTDTDSGYKCFCYEGYTEKGNQCIPQSSKEAIYLLYSSYNNIYAVQLFENSNPNSPQALKNINTHSNIISFDVQANGNEMILYSSLVEIDNIISIAQLDTWPFHLSKSSNMKYAESNLGNLSIFSTAFDPARNLLFYTDIKNHIISVINVTSMDKLTIIDQDITTPYNIVIDPVYLKIFWIDLDGPRIWMSNMDGTSRMIVIEKGLRKPTSLAIDINEQKLYWVDNLPGTIQYIDITSINATNKKIVSFMVLQNILVQPFSLFVFGNRVYWSDWILGGIFSAHKISGKDVKLVSNGHQQKSIRIFSNQYNIQIINKVREQKSLMGCSGLINSCPYSCLPNKNSQFPLCFGFPREKKSNHHYLWLIVIPVILIILCLSIYKLRPTKTIIVRQTLNETVHIQDSVKFWEEDQNSVHDDIQIKDTTPIIIKT